MLKNFYPYEYVESVFSIDYEKIYNKGYRGIIFDIDNTLTHHGEGSTKEVDQLFKEIHKIGLKTILLTDNNEERVLSFIKNIKTPYICEAQKPKVESFLKAVDELKLPKDKVLYIGDQIFLDVYGANKSGIDNILVKFMRREDETKIGKKRQVEKIILKFYKLNKKSQNRLGDILKDSEKKKNKRSRKLFCEINPFCYELSRKKEIIKRHVKNLCSKKKFSKFKSDRKLKNIVFTCQSNMIKKAPGVNLESQINKAININLASKKINGIIVKPGEVFSLWKLVGAPSKRKGYKKGRIIKYNKLVPGVGGGLCNLANSIHLLILHSPLDVIEFHKHSDALAPDEGKRVPFSSGTAVSYNVLDYQFKNNTDQKIQLNLWCDEDMFYGELRSEKPFPYSYEIFEEDHCFKKENDVYYRCSKIYRKVINRKTKKFLKNELVLDNHSEVMYDYSLIPVELIKNN